jgi:hypothetical protein
MDYTKHYNLLIERAKSREITGYVEKHHIVPKCMGGNNDKSNIVKLTPEEHYVAHQLLVKMYPKVTALIYAANRMTTFSKFTKRNNKCFAWLRKKHKDACKKRTGKKNSQYGSMWITDGQENKKIDKGSIIPEGWYKGRYIEKKKRKCMYCKSLFTPNNEEKYCSDNCRQAIRSADFRGRENELKDLLNQGLSLNSALKAMGYPGAVSHWYKWAKKVSTS